MPTDSRRSGLPNAAFSRKTLSDLIRLNTGVTVQPNVFKTTD